MEKLKKFCINILVVAYALIAITVTILMLSFNEYHVSVIGGYTFIIVNDDELEEHGFDRGTLLLIKQTKAKNINPGDEIFLYRKISNTQFEIKYAEVLLKDTSKGAYNASYVLEGGISVSHESVIGTTEDLKVVPYLGTILSILQSRYGYLFLIVVVSFIAFLYEIYELVMEIKYGDREDEEEDYEYDEEYDEYDEEDYEEYEEEEEPDEIIIKKPRQTTKKAATKTTATKTTVSKTTKSTPKPTSRASTKATSTSANSKANGGAKTAGTKKATTTTRATGTKTTRTTTRTTGTRATSAKKPATKKTTTRAKTKSE